MLVLTLLSLFILTSFIFLGIQRYGLLGSYSAYASKWGTAFNLHYWSLVTFLAAFLMIPPMIDAGIDNTLQFLGFFAPLYLIVVSLTPEYETNASQRKVHVIGALACAALAFCWIIFVCHMWYTILILAVIMLGLAYWRKAWDSYIFWGEMIMFGSAYLTLIIG